MVRNAAAGRRLGVGGCVRVLGAFRVYLILQGFTAFAFAVAFTITAIYRVRVAGLDPLQLVLVGTVLEASCFLFEIPTGVVADTYSRRLSVIVGVLLMGLSFFIEGCFPVFGAILLAQVVAGFGYTFTSGATEAWIADEIGESRAADAFMRGAQAGQIGGVLGTGLSVLLAGVQLSLPILLAGVLTTGLGLFLVAVMPERGFRVAPREKRASWSAMFGTFHAGLRAVRRRPLLLTILAISAVWGASSEGFDRLWEAHILASYELPSVAGLDPVVWFGVIRVVGMLLGVAGTELVRRRLAAESPGALAGTLTVLTALLVVGVAGFGLAGDFATALAAFWLATVARRVSAPLFTAWINQQIEPGIRATVLSMHGQVDAFGQIGGGPLIGAVGTHFSLRAAIVVAAACLTPALPLLARTFQGLTVKQTTGDRG